MTFPEFFRWLKKEELVLCLRVSHSMVLRLRWQVLWRQVRKPRAANWFRHQR